MALRADQILILGVAGLGLYALYRMSRANGESPENGLRTEPRPIPNLPTGALPDLPGIATLPASIASVQGNPIQLVNSRAYFGRLETVSPAGEPSNRFPPNASKIDLINAVSALSFDGARVYMTPEEASQALRTPEALVNAGRGTRWFYGRWTEPTMAQARPPELALLWVTRGPPAQIGFMAPRYSPYPTMMG